MQQKSTLTLPSVIDRDPIFFRLGDVKASMKELKSQAKSSFAIVDEARSALSDLCGVKAEAADALLSTINLLVPLMRMANEV